MDLKKLLNKAQYDAATTINGPLLVLAGAGSGKTRVLTYRIANMIKNEGIYPSQILAITFTNKAASEMKERIQALIGGNTVDSMWVSTFHSSCVRILRREIDKIGYNKNFTIYDSYDSKTLVKLVMKELQIDEKDITDKEIINKIGESKDSLISPEQFKIKNEKNFRMNKIADAYLLYQKKLKSNNALDFDDLIYKTVELFKKVPEVLEFYQRKFKYIMVDEYQDTNMSQYTLARLLSEGHGNLCVVGDDDQCLPVGTLLESENGKIKVEDLKEGDSVLCGSGNGETTLGKIDKITKREYAGKLIKVTTESGKVIKSTPNHITFSRIDVVENIYYVYLMYKKGLGYRIGQTSSVRSRDEQLVNGLAVRINGEQADKIWIIKCCKDKSEATYYEQYYSVKYGIPTVVFNARGRNITLSQEQINKLFSEINTFEAADKLMEDNYLDFNYPHHFSSAVVRGETSRKIVNLSFFSGKRSIERNYNSHRISLNTSGEDEKELFKTEGFPVRDGQRNTWRIETERAIYDDAEKYAKGINAVNEDLEIIRKAKLTGDKNFYFMPMGSIKEGMLMAVKDGNKIVEDRVISVEIEDYSGYVYDLSVPNLRQYVANDVVVHNCIYGWRGADIKNILNFHKDYPSAKIVKLEENYRSMANILDAANSVIRNNPHEHEKTLKTINAPGEKIKVYRAYSDLDEGQFVASEIKRLISEDNKTYKDFAILYRTNAQSRIFEDAFIKRDIPYRIIGGLKFYDRKEIKDIMAYLKLINNPVDDVSLQRIINVPKRSIGDATVQKLVEFANYMEEPIYSTLLDIENVPGLTPRAASSLNKFASIINSFIRRKDEIKVSDLIKEILNETGYLAELKNSKATEDLTRIENLQELVSAATDFETNNEDKSLSAFLEKTTLVADVDNYNEDANTVILMTVHSAKGLEFPVVYMVGMENGLFPGTLSFNDNSEMEESRRLCYVGITRAKEKLYMTSAEVRNVFGKTVSYAQSDFLNEINPDLKEYVNIKRQYNSSNSSNSFRSTSFSGNKSGLNLIPKSMNTSSLEIGTTKDENLKVKVEIQTLKEDNAKMGTKIKHSKFGIGTIVSVSKRDGHTYLTIAFVNNGVKNLRMDMAPMEIV